MGGGTSFLGKGGEDISSEQCSHNWLLTGIFFMSVPDKDLSFEDVMNVMFSTVPTDVVFIFLIAFIIRRTTRTLALALFVPILSLLNKISALAMTGCDHCPRPATSCVKGDGMPSGHSSNAYGLLMWLILETFAGWGWRWPAWKQLATFFSYCAIIGPVPYSRVYLGDHTEFQVLVGAWVGVSCAVLWFVLLQRYAGPKLGGICEWKLAKRIGLRDTYWEAQKAAASEAKDSEGHPSLPMIDDEYDSVSREQLYPQTTPSHTHHDLHTNPVTISL